MKFLYSLFAIGLLTSFSASAELAQTPYLEENQVTVFVEVCEASDADVEAEPIQSCEYQAETLELNENSGELVKAGFGGRSCIPGLNCPPGYNGQFNSWWGPGFNSYFYFDFRFGWVPRNLYNPGFNPYGPSVAWGSVCRINQWDGCIMSQSAPVGTVCTCVRSNGWNVWYINGIVSFN